jgi:oxygen-dependent protoporphyrinogen oxidase
VALATTGVPLDRSPFVALANGMSSLVQALEQRLGGAILCNAPARVLRREADRWVVEAGGVDGPIAARAVILAAPAFVAADLLAPIDAEAARICAEVEYVSTASVALAWRKSDVPHPLQGTGFVVARRHSDVRITACTWVSSKWQDRAGPGDVLLRAFLGGIPDPDAVLLPDEALVDIAVRDLAGVLQIPDPPRIARVYRWIRAGAQHNVGHARRVAGIDARLAAHPGLFVAGSGFRSIGVPDCVADGRAVARRVAGHLGLRSE